MSGALTGVVLAAAVAAIVLIFILTARRRKGPPRASAREPGPPAAGRRWLCPVCGALLGPGERIRSIITLSPKHGRIMEISGCPQCLPPASRGRTCPVCRASLGSNDVLVARVFDPSRETAKPRVHVLGCNRCRG